VRLARASRRRRRAGRGARGPRAEPRRRAHGRPRPSPGGRRRDPRRAHRGRRLRRGDLLSHRPRDPRARPRRPHGRARLLRCPRPPPGHGLRPARRGPRGDAELRRGGGTRGGGGEDAFARRVDPRAWLARREVVRSDPGGRPGLPHPRRALRRLPGQPGRPHAGRRPRRPRQRQGHGASGRHRPDPRASGRRDHPRRVGPPHRCLRRQRGGARRAGGAHDGGDPPRAGDGDGRVSGKGRDEPGRRGRGPGHPRSLPGGGGGGETAHPPLRHGRRPRDAARPLFARDRARGGLPHHPSGEALRGRGSRLAGSGAPRALCGRPRKPRAARDASGAPPRGDTPGSGEGLPGRHPRHRRPRQPGGPRRLRAGARRASGGEGPAAADRARPDPRRDGHSPLRPPRGARLHPGHPLPVGSPLGAEAAGDGPHP
jgi:hypothetical protein